MHTGDASDEGGGASQSLQPVCDSSRSRVRPQGQTGQSCPTLNASLNAFGTGAVCNRAPGPLATGSATGCATGMATQLHGIAAAILRQYRQQHSLESNSLLRAPAADKGKPTTTLPADAGRTAPGRPTSHPQLNRTHMNEISGLASNSTAPAMQQLPTARPPPHRSTCQATPLLLTAPWLSNTTGTTAMHHARATAAETATAAAAHTPYTSRTRPATPPVPG